MGESPYEWAVEMEPLHESRTLRTRLTSGDLSFDTLERLGARGAEGHLGAGHEQFEASPES